MLGIVTTDVLVLAALTGIFGAPHCIGMCGGTVSGIALNADTGVFRAVTAYNLGRITTYTGLGALMGAAGSFVDTAGGLTGIQGIASILGGIFILLWVFGKYAVPLARWGPMRFPSVKSLLLKLKKSPESWAIYSSGVLLGFIPCGMTYAMQMNAAASSGVWSGALIMAVFGLSTLPAMLVTGLFAGSIKKPLRSRMMLAGQIVAVWIGILSILRGMAANSWIPGVHPWLW